MNNFSIFLCLRPQKKPTIRIERTKKPSSESKIRFNNQTSFKKTNVSKLYIENKNGQSCQLWPYLTQHAPVNNLNPNLIFNDEH